MNPLVQQLLARLKPQLPSSNNLKVPQNPPQGSSPGSMDQVNQSE